MLVGAFNQEKALVGAFFVIVQPVVEAMDRFTALYSIQYSRAALLIADWGTPIFHPATTSSIHTTAPSKWFDTTSADDLLLQTISSLKTLEFP